MTRPRLPRGVRARLLTIVLLALAGALAGATYGFNILFAAASWRDADLLLRQQADSERALIRVADGRLRVLEASKDELGDRSVWLFEGGKLLERPPARAETTAAARTLARGRSRYVTIEASDMRLYSRPVFDGGRRVGTVVTGISLAPYEQTRRTALLSSLAFALALLAIVAVAVWWLLRTALRPVAHMTEQAAAWSEHDLDRRFARGEPHDELTRLAATLDQLLARIAASLRHERQLSAELSHELRTPLAKLLAEAELAQRRPRTDEEYRAALADVVANGSQITRIVETLLAAAQQQAGAPGIASAADVANAVADACAPAAAERGVHVLVADPVTALRIGVGLDLAERILHPVIDNACRYGQDRVVVSIAADNGDVLFTVDDDGPGVPSEERETIFEPAVRGAAGHGSGRGAGLGLSLARRLARSVAGEVASEPAAAGARFVVRLPAA